MSFYYGTRVRKCAINYDYQSANLYQRRVNQPLRLFGAIRPSHYQILGQLFAQVNSGDFKYVKTFKIFFQFIFEVLWDRQYGLSLPYTNRTHGSLPRKKKLA